MGRGGGLSLTYLNTQHIFPRYYNQYTFLQELPSNNNITFSDFTLSNLIFSDTTLLSRSPLTKFTYFITAVWLILLELYTEYSPYYFQISGYSLAEIAEFSFRSIEANISATSSQGHYLKITSSNNKINLEILSNIQIYTNLTLE